MIKASDHIRTRPRRALRLRLALLALLALPAVGLAVPPIQHWTQDNGARVYFVETRDLPIVDLRLVFDAAAARDGDLPGLARATIALIDQGNGGLDAGQVADRLERVGARLSGGSERDMAWLHLRSLSRKEALDPAVDTLALIVGKPDFPDAELERVRGQMLVGLQAIRQSPGDLGNRAFYSAVYGDHPYASPPDGTEESIKKITRRHVQDFYRRYYTAPNVVIAIAGDIDRKQAEAIAERIGAALPKGERAPTLPPVPKLKQSARQHIEFSSSQSHIMIGQPAISRNDPDIFAFAVGNHLLGGSGLVSIISSAMREERGLSYSSGSYFVASAQPGPFIMYTQVRNESAGEAITVLKEIFTEMVKHGPSEEALDAAKRNITGSFPLNLDSNQDIVGYLSSIGFYNLPLDYLDTYIANIEKVTAADVKRAFQRHLDPEALVTVLVGPEQAERDAARDAE